MQITATTLVIGILLQLGVPVTPSPLTGEDPAHRVAAALGALACFELAAGIVYEVDAQDYWQTPEETLQRGHGDCEDKALYLLELLRRAGLQAEVVFGVADLRKSDVMHAWVEIDVAGQAYVMDPTQGFVARRDHMAAGSHTPVLGMPSILGKIQEYERRTGLPSVNRYYAHMLAMIHPPDERVASR